MAQSSIAAHLHLAALSSNAALLYAGGLVLLLVFASCVKLPRSKQIANEQSSNTQPGPTPASLIHLNTASRAELEKLPGVGEGIAGRIIEHREKFGPFRRVEQVLMVRGISESRFRQMRPFLTVE
jgi:competence protein ComEA